MKNGIILTLIALFLIVSPAIAAPPSHSNANANATKDNPGRAKSEEVKNDNANNVEEIVGEATESPVTPSPVESTDQPAEESPPTQSVGGVEAVIPLVEDGECDPNADWKNHGEYVSCVAHTHPGGQVVSEAARSDIGKKPPITSAIPTVESGFSPLASLSALLGKALGLLRHLF